MTNARPHQYMALTADDHDFICRVAAYAADRLFKYNPDLSKHRNELDRASVYREFRSELRSLLTSPHTATTKHLGIILKHMKNIHRLQLLQMRPNLIRSFRRLAEILHDYIPDQDKLSIACFCLDSLSNKDEEIYARNIATLDAMLPQDAQNQFLKLAIKHMNSDIERKQQKENGTMQARKPMPKHAASFSAAFILSAAGLISQYYTDPLYRNVALLSAAGCAAHGFYDLHQEGRLGRIFTPITRQWHAFWNPAEKTPAATDNKLAIPSPRL